MQMFHNHYTSKDKYRVLCLHCGSLLTKINKDNLHNHTCSMIIKSRIKFHRFKCTHRYITLSDLQIMLTNVTQCNLVQKAKKETPARYSTISSGVNVCSSTQLSLTLRTLKQIVISLLSAPARSSISVTVKGSLINYFVFQRRSLIIVLLYFKSKQKVRNLALTSSFLYSRMMCNTNLSKIRHIEQLVGIKQSLLSQAKIP